MMRETRIYCPIDVNTGERAVLPDAAAHHVSRVLRKRAGQRLILFNGEGSGWLAEIIAVDRQRVEVEILARRDEDRESRLALTLVQCISRGQHMDFTIQKAVELGVSRIVPVISEHSNVKLSADRLPGKLRHWRQIIISACEQCGRNRLPQLDTPRVLAEWLDSDSAGCKLILHPGSGQGLATMEPPADAVSLLAGPEGGLSDAEVEEARLHGYMAVELGPRILRTETAPIAALSIIQFRWGDLGPG